MIKSYKHKPTGRILHKGVMEPDYYFHESKRELPAWVVESGNDWEEVKEREPIKANRYLGGRVTFSRGKYEINLSDTQISAIEDLLNEVKEGKWSDEEVGSFTHEVAIGWADHCVRADKNGSERLNLRDYINERLYKI